MSEPFDRSAVVNEMADARTIFAELVERLGPAELSRQTNGTRWTNRQMLFHYLIVSALIRVVKIVSAMPAPFQRGFANMLDVAHRPFHWINYAGSAGGGTVLTPRLMLIVFDRVIARLQHKLIAESESSLERTMHFPPRWDPFFTDQMTLGAVYRYATQHFEFHRQQLSA